MPQNFRETERSLEDFVNQVWRDHPPKTRKEQHEAELNRSRLTLQKFKQDDAGPTATDINIAKSSRSLNNKSGMGKAMTLINEEEFKPSDVFQTEHVLPGEPSEAAAAADGSASEPNKEPTQVEPTPANSDPAPAEPAPAEPAPAEPAPAEPAPAEPAPAEPAPAEPAPAPAAAPPKTKFSLFGKKK